MHFLYFPDITIILVTESSFLKKNKGKSIYTL